jgi:hypothetical protein
MAAAASVNVTQLVAETLSQPTPDARVTQAVVELLATSVSTAASEARVTQDAIELLSQPTPDARVSQHVVELLSGTVPSAAAEARVTQAVVELLAPAPVIASDARVSQLVTETLTLQPPSPVRVSQIPLELLGVDQPAARVSQTPVEIIEQFAPALVFARVSQAPLEIIYPFDGTCYAPAVPGEPLIPGLRYIRRLRRAPHVQQAHRRIAYARFALDLQRGVGLPTGQGADPLVTVRLSRDGGKTWGAPVPMRAGKLGAYTTRVVARRLGQARDAVFEVTVSDPVAWALVQAWLDLEPGTS